MKKCVVCKEEFNNNPFVYCDKCLVDGGRVYTVLSNEIASLTDKLKRKNTQIKGLKKKEDKLENLKSLIRAILANNFAKKETYRKALQEALRYN